MIKQFIYGTQYTDELIMIRVTNKGELYVHQDANWNVIALTDLGGHVVERYIYRPYGEVVVHQETSYGDYDGDQDVDTTDRDAYDGSSPSGAERILDLDFDGDVDGTDSTLFDNNLTLGISRHPGRISTGVEQPFGHQGLMYDAEITSYQNRHRQLASTLRRFLQRDPAGYVDGMSLYSYCGSNPIVGVDSLGLRVYRMPTKSYSYKINANKLLIPDRLPPFLGHNTYNSKTHQVQQPKPEKAKFGTEFEWYALGGAKINGIGLIKPDGTIIKPCYWHDLFGRFNLLPDNPWALGWWYWHSTPFEQATLDDPDSIDIPNYWHDTPFGQATPDIKPYWWWNWEEGQGFRWLDNPQGDSETAIKIDKELNPGESDTLKIWVEPDLSKPGVGGEVLVKIRFTCGTLTSKGNPASKISRLVPESY
jgi:RHS repeat-associated protein